MIVTVKHCIKTHKTIFGVGDLVSLNLKLHPKVGFEFQICKSNVCVRKKVNTDSSYRTELEFCSPQLVFFILGKPYHVRKKNPISQTR